MKDWNSSSLYHVQKFVNYSDNEKENMFDYLCLDLSKSHNANQLLKQTIFQLTEQIETLEQNNSESNSKCRVLSLTNKLLNEEKDQVISTSVKLQNIIDNWAKSHNNLNKILDAQIPHQRQKILGGDIDGVVNSFKSAEPE